jgi:PadR family transcriptional regulator PadR
MRCRLRRAEGVPMAADDQFIRGAGMLAVLKVLEGGELYGYAIVEALARTKGDALHLGQSTVYPMLYNLEAKGLVKSRWDESGARPRKYYSLTKAGKTRLAEDTDQWREITKAMASLGLARLGLARLGLAQSGFVKFGFARFSPSILALG